MSEGATLPQAFGIQTHAAHAANRTGPVALERLRASDYMSDVDFSRCECHRSLPSRLSSFFTSSYVSSRFDSPFERSVTLAEDLSVQFHSWPLD